MVQSRRKYAVSDWLAVVQACRNSQSECRRPSLSGYMCEEQNTSSLGRSSNLDMSKVSCGSDFTKEKLPSALSFHGFS